MENICGPEASQETRSGEAEYYDTLAEQMPELDLLFRGFAEGKMPDFLELMSALSDMVAYHTDCDTKLAGPASDTKFMSQNKCRFCDC